MNPATLAEWTKAKVDYGHRGESFQPLIDTRGSGDLSFYNAIEAHMLMGTRRIHKVSMLSVRRAMEWVRREMPSPHPLVDYRFKTNGKHLFISKLAEEQITEPEREGSSDRLLYNASLFGQLPIESIVNLFLNRIHYADSVAASRLFPISPKTNGENSPVMMDMNFASGQLVVSGSGITVASVYGRFKNSNHSIEKLAKDYHLSPASIRGAIEYFEAAA